MLGSTARSSFCVLVSWPAASDKIDKSNFIENGEKMAFDCASAKIAYHIVIQYFISNKKSLIMLNTFVSLQSNWSCRGPLYGVYSSLSQASGLESSLCWICIDLWFHCIMSDIRSAAYTLLVHCEANISIDTEKLRIKYNFEIYLFRSKEYL